jgi:type II secretory pathway pseudopilin PulG
MMHSLTLRTPCTRACTHNRWVQASHSAGSLPSNAFIGGTPKGFAYIALLVALVIIGISLGAAGKYWQSVVLRDKEEELLFRGDQYRQAIERYYRTIPAIPQYPPSIDDLLKDPRTASGKRHLRQKYKDPFTGENFIEIRDTLSKRIIGVHSGSDRTPLKQANFPEIYQDFAGKSKYSDWQFIPIIQSAQTLTGGIPLLRQLPTRPRP